MQPSHLEGAGEQANSPAHRGASPTLSWQRGGTDYLLNPHPGALASPHSLAWELRLFRHDQEVVEGQAR